jgi:uncharacterized small protein (DUF1192 family)
MIKTTDNKIEITKEIKETIDLKDLDLRISCLQEDIERIQKEINEKQTLRDSITQTFPEIESLIYPAPLPAEDMI